MVQYDNMVTPEAMRKAAQTIRQGCEQYGCLYCPLHFRVGDNIHCLVNDYPRKWNMQKIMDGGKHNA